MNCERARQFLDAFAAGELDVSQRQNVEEHVERCAACQKELAAMRRTISFLMEFHELDPPADFVPQLRERIESRRRRPILERFLPRPAFARALAAVSCVMLAGLGIWMAVRQFVPRGQLEKNEAGDEIRGERVAFVRDTDDDLRPNEAERSDSEDVRGSKKPEFLDRSEAGGGTRYSDTYENRRGKAPGVEGRRAELSGGVPAKGTLSTATSSPAAPISSEELPRVEVENEVQVAHGDAIRSYTAQEREPTKETSEVEDTVVVKALPETWDMKLKAVLPDSPSQEIAKAEGESPARYRIALDTRGAEEDETSGVELQRENEEIGEPLQEQLEAKETIYAEGAGFEAKSGISQKRLDLLADEESHMAKLRERTSGERAAVGKDVGGDGIEIWDGQERLRDESTLLGATFDVQKPVLDESDLDSLPHDYAYTHLYFNGAAKWKEGTTGLLGDEPSDAGVENRLHFDPVTFAGYGTTGTGMPALVRYIKDREKARAEIEKIVAGLGGSVHSRAADAENSSRAFGEAAVDTLIVKLKPGVYETFLGKLGGKALQKRASYRGSRVAGPDAARSTDEPAGSAGTPGKDAGVILAIFLVEIREQEKPDQPPQKRHPSGS